MKIPMREKYVDEAVGIWFEFGTHPSGNVDISDGNRDVFVDVPKAVAQELIAAHDKFRDELYRILCLREPTRD